MEELGGKLNQVAKAQQETRDFRALQVLAVTYNLGGKCFDIEGDANNEGLAQLDDLFRKDEAWHDIYVLATQEAERSIYESMFDESKKKLTAAVKAYFNIPED